jgi:hypothetical protein
MKILILKLIKNTILSFLPLLNIKSINYNFLNNYNVPFTLNKYSTYINFKLDNDQKNIIQDYLNNYSSNLLLVPIKIFPTDSLDYYLSINFYNCTSPLFYNNNKEITRCEINTYVKDENNNTGTLILDYTSNHLSLDPINLFKNKNKLYFLKKNDFLEINSNNKLFSLSGKMNTLNYKKKKISKNLIKFTNNIFYKNNIYDKLTYDDSLENTYINLIPKNKIENFNFQYNNINFTNIHSIFYFENNIYFLCRLWFNL